LVSGPTDDTRRVSQFEEPPKEVYLDYLPVAADAVELFLLKRPGKVEVSELTKDGVLKQVLVPASAAKTKGAEWSFTVWGYRGVWGPFPAIDPEQSAPGSVGWVGEEWTLKELIAPKFPEPFRVFAKGTTYFFVTASGKVYLARKPEQGERTLELLWDDPNRPVVAILDDVDRGETYVFAKNQQAIINAKDCYFALSDKPRVVEFSPFELKPVKAPEPLRTVTQYARLLAERREGAK
jgi:hypothetical protein